MRWCKQDLCLEVVQGDITVQKTDAIVNAANKALAPGGGVAGAIHRAAGPKLWEECKTLGGCETGEAKVTKGYELPAAYVVHTVGPVYGQDRDSDRLLAQAYSNSLKCADQTGLKSISFPALSTGAFGYPLQEAADIALRTLFQDLPRMQSLRFMRMILRSTSDLEVHQEAAQRIAQEYGWQEMQEG